MTINQLFKNKPPISLINELVKGFGLEDINDSKVFSRKDIELLNILEFMENMSKKLDDYYLPCKKKIYFSNLTSKKCITILRQCIKLYNYKLVSKEKYIKSEKIIIYNISPIGNVIYENKKTNGCIISFD
jgi:hypothetical protein